MIAMMGQSEVDTSSTAGTGKDGGQNPGPWCTLDIREFDRVVRWLGWSVDCRGHVLAASSDLKGGRDLHILPIFKPKIARSRLRLAGIEQA